MQHTNHIELFQWKINFTTDNSMFNRETQPHANPKRMEEGGDNIW